MIINLFKKVFIVFLALQIAMPSVFALSNIEEEFQKATTTTTKKTLQQIGYDLFSYSNVFGGGAKYGSNYTLNIGEKLNIYFYGDSMDVISMSNSSLMSPIAQTQVDTKGNIFVAGIGVVKAEGRTINEIEKSIQSMASQKYNNLKVKVTISDSTEFSVFVYGQVNRPGKVNVTGNSSFVEALGAAGGVKKSGSLRKITYTGANGKKQNIDLYSSLFEGKMNNIKLNANDIIYVNNLGPVVALQEGVKVPGIYEVLPEENIIKIINYAGGVLPSTDLSKVNIQFYASDNGQRSSIDINYDKLKKHTLKNGDIITFQSKYDKAQDFVTLNGNVKHAGVFTYKQGMKLSDLIKSNFELQNETFIHQATIKRVVGEDKQVITIPVSLEDMFKNKRDIVLQPQDVITVYKNTNLSFVDVYGCIDNPKQYPYRKGLTLKDLLSNVQFVYKEETTISEQKENETKDVFSNESNIKEVADKTEQNLTENKSTTLKTNIKKFSKREKKALEKEKRLAQEELIKNDKNLIPAENVAVEITDIGGKTTTYYLYEILVNTDQLGTIVINEGDKIFLRPLRSTEDIKTVRISGFVRRPGVYSFVKGKKLKDVISQAGGLTEDADLRGIVLKRPRLTANQVKIVKQNNEKDIRELEGLMAGSDALTASKTDKANQKAVIEGIEESEKSLGSKYDARIALNITSRDIDKFPEKANIEIQDGDTIFIPKYSNHITVLGEVYNETSFIYDPNMTSKDYIKASGGFTTIARKTKVYKVSVNGNAKRLGLFANKKVEPGDTLIVPRKIKGNDWITPVCSAIQAITDVASSVYIITNLKK